MVQSAWAKPGRFANRQKQPKLEDLLPIKKFKSGIFYTERFIGPPHTFAEHWPRIITKAGKEVGVRKLCLSYDHESGEFKGGCPYCDVLGDNPKIITLQNSIDRKAQRNEPRDDRKTAPIKSETRLHTLGDGREYYFKDKDSETWTPVFPLRLTSGPCQSIGNYAAINKHTTKSGAEKVFVPEHPSKGFDIKIKYDENASPANAYFVSKEKNTRFTEDEVEYLIYKLDVEAPETLAVAQKNAEELSSKLAPKEGEAPAAGSPGAAKKAAKNYLGDPDANDDDNEEEAPPPKKKRVAAVEPNNNNNDDDEEEEEAPPPKKKRLAAAIDDSEDEPPRKRRAAPVEPNNDDDEAEAPPPKKRRRDGLDL